MIYVWSTVKVIFLVHQVETSRKRKLRKKMIIEVRIINNQKCRSCYACHFRSIIQPDAAKVLLLFPMIYLFLPSALTWAGFPLAWKVKRNLPFPNNNNNNKSKINVKPRHSIWLPMLLIQTCRKAFNSMAPIEFHQHHTIKSFI